MYEELLWSRIRGLLIAYYYFRYNSHLGYWMAFMEMVTCIFHFYFQT